VPFADILSIVGRVKSSSQHRSFIILSLSLHDRPLFIRRLVSFQRGNLFIHVIGRV